MGRGKRGSARVAAVSRQSTSRQMKGKRGKITSRFLPYQQHDIYDLVDIVGSEEHRDLLEFQIRANSGKVTSVRFSPGEGSKTDMKGRVWVDSHVPSEDADPVDRAICIEALGDHEGLHVEITDPHVFVQFHKDLDEKAKEETKLAAAAAGKKPPKTGTVQTPQGTASVNLGALEASMQGQMMKGQIHRIWNALEDGMIESWQRDNRPDRYRYLQALAKLAPAVQYEDKLEKAIAFPEPKEGYHPTDAKGKKLKKVTGADGTVTYQAAKGTPITPWGDTPLGLAAQMDAALLAESLPHYKVPVKSLHPKVKACFDECKPYIRAAVAGNTADCADAAYNIYQLLKKHDLLPVVEFKDGQTMVMMPGGAGGQGQPMPGGMGMPISAPEGMEFAMEGGSGQGQPGQGAQSPKNPMPSVKGRPEPGGELGETLKGGGGAEGEEGEEGGEGSGGGKQGKEGDEEGEGAGGGKDGEKEGDKEGEGADGKDGKDGEDGDKDGKGKGKNSGEGEEGEGKDSGSDGQQSGQHYAPGGASGIGGFNADKEVPSTGEVDQALEDLREKMRNKLDDAATSATQASNAKTRGRGSKAVRWKASSGDTIVRVEDMKGGSVNKALEDEAGKFTYAGRALAQKMRKIKDTAEEDRVNLRYGRLDRKKLTRAVAGNPRIMKRVQIEEAGDVEIDVAVDLSGSTDGDRQDQYRMCMMFGIAGQQTRTPVTIWGGDAGGHYELKRKDDRSLESLKNIFRAGGGGTQTQDWIEFARSRLSLSDAKHRWHFVITDGASFDKGATRDQVERARKEGVDVFGLAFGCNARDMDDQFGSGNWAVIDDYTQAPKIAWRLIERTLRGRLGV